MKGKKALQIWYDFVLFNRIQCKIEATFEIFNKNMKYGLNRRIPPPQQKQKASKPPVAPPLAFAFKDDDNNEDDVEMEISRQAAKNRARQKVI